MYRVGIVGHRPEYVPDQKLMTNTIDRVIDLISYQYDEDLIINVGGEIGVEQWTSEICGQRNVKYHLFLPCHPDLLSVEWYEDQKRVLDNCFKKSWATTVYSHEYSREAEVKNHEHVVNMSDFIICFWNGMKQGTTFNSIIYALKQNKITLNGLNDLKLITNEDI